MKQLVALAAAGLLLGGCFAPAIGGGLKGAVVAVGAKGAAGGAGGFVTGWLSNPTNDLTLFNDTLKADAPLKALYCVTHEPLPPVWEAYCRHIPTDASQVPATFLYMLNASKP